MKTFKLLIIFCQNAQTFAGTLLIFRFPIELIHQILMSLHFSINFSRFSQKISRIFMPFSIVILYLSYLLSFFNKFRNLILEFTENFSGFIGYQKRKFKIIFRKNSEILFNYVQFYEIFLRKNGSFGEEKCWHFWQMNSFSNTLTRFQKWKFATVRGGLAPRTPWGGRLIAIKCPGRSPPPPAEKVPGAATVNFSTR